jgi:hypothetical protein
MNRRRRRSIEWSSSFFRFIKLKFQTDTAHTHNNSSSRLVDLAPSPSRRPWR